MVDVAEGFTIGKVISKVDAEVPLFDAVALKTVDVAEQPVQLKSEVVVLQDPPV
jgi:hypothetical protein